MGLASIKGMANLPVFQSVVRMILIATHWSQRREWIDQLPTKEEVSIFLASIYCNIPEIQSKLDRSNFKRIMDNISETEITDDFFFNHTEELLIILSIISSHNIKIIFVINRVVKMPGYTINNGF